MKLPAPCLYLIGALIATMALSQCTPALAVSTKPIIVETPLSAKPITTQSLSRYAAQARKSNGPNFGEFEHTRRTGLQWAFSVCNLQPCAAHGEAEGDTRKGMPVTCVPVRQPLQSCRLPFGEERQDSNTQGAPDHG